MVQALQLSLYIYVNSFADIKFSMTLKDMLLKISLKYKHYFLSKIMNEAEYS